jgi:quercetin dioxygenase-like cupin family protein
MTTRMKLAHIYAADHATPERFFAMPLIEGEHSSVRLIRLAAGQALPPHRHGRSDLMLYVAEGVGELGPPGEGVTFERGALAYLPGDEELHVRNTGPAEMTLLAYLAPRPGSS